MPIGQWTDLSTRAIDVLGRVDVILAEDTRVSPIHHHFELEGWKETKVVIRFWILSLLFAIIGLATLKLR